MTGTAALYAGITTEINAAAYLPATVRSVLRQTFRDIELLVVDDGSTDDTAAAALDAAEGDARLRVISPGVNQGRSAARNLGIDAALGDWVCPTDADDLWARGRLAALVRAARRFPLATAVTDDVMGFRIDASGEIRLGHRYASRASWWVGGTHVLERRGWYVDRDCHMRPIIRRDFLTATGLRYPVEMSSGEDLCLLTQVAFSPSATFTVRVAEPNYYYREGESTRAANMAESRVRGARRAIEGTGSAELATLVDTVGRGTQWRLARGDARYAAASRSGERDPGVDDITLNPDPVRGVGQLLRLKAIEAVGRAADHQLRPGIVRDIEGQLAPNDR